MRNAGCDVLVVDDDRDILQTFEDALSAEGYKVAVAENGQVALDLLREMPHDPCLILLDMMMPVMSGAEMLQVLERTHRREELHVAIVSAHVTHIEGIERVIRKPVSLPELLEVAAEFCGQRP
jgi:CheY-like chemotaxis protein